MKTRKIQKELARLAERYDVRKGHKFRLEDVDPGDTSGIKSEAHALKLLSRSTEVLSRPAGEALRPGPVGGAADLPGAWTRRARTARSSTSCPGSIRRAATCTRSRRRATEELDHDFLWRATRPLPERGRIGIFNRSYYEEVLVVRVHPEHARRPSSCRSRSSASTSGTSATRTSTPTSAISPGTAW